MTLPATRFFGNGGTGDIPGDVVPFIESSPTSGSEAAWRGISDALVAGIDNRYRLVGSHASDVLRAEFERTAFALLQLDQPSQSWILIPQQLSSDPPRLFLITVGSESATDVTDVTQALEDYSADEASAAAKDLFSTAVLREDPMFEEFQHELFVFVDRYGPIGVKYLLPEILALGGTDERAWVAIRLLSRHPNRRTMRATRNLLIHLLSSTDSALRYSVAEGLGEIGGGESARALESQLTSEKNPSVRAMIDAQLRK